MAKLRSTDDMMKEYLISTRQDSLDAQRDARIEAADPGYLDQESTRERDAYAEEGRQFRDVVLADKGRDLGEHLQDMGSGVLGSLVGGVGGAGDLALQAIADSIANVGGAAAGLDATWDRTAGALERIGQNQETFRSMQSEKSDAFDRISAYRQQRAVEQANLESQAETGEDASWLDTGAAEMAAAAETYLSDPSQILTEGVAQLPYLIGGGVAKGITTGTKLANPLIAQLVARGMVKESAEKLVQMGIVGGVTGSMEGADAASSAYARVMASTDTFGPGQEAERESAALEAAGKAFLIAGSTAAVTGTLASKFDLSPFSAVGGSALARSGDNLVKALQEGVQEAIESGTSQFAGNYAGNTVLKGEDLVALDQGVGGAAGTGLVVGAGSTVVTNPRSALDAAAAPLALAGRGLGALGARAQNKEYRADQAASQKTADDIVADSGDAAVTAALQPILDSTGAELTTRTPSENVVLPPEIVTDKTPFHQFASGMEYLEGKDMNSRDAVTAFHVLGTVLENALIAGRVRDNLQEVIDNPETAPETKAAAQEKLTLINSMVDQDKLNAFVEDLDTDQIDKVLGQLEENPEQFGPTVAHLAALNPMKVSAKMLNSSALESKSLPPDQRNSIELAKELQAAEAELNVKAGPTSSEVSRSIMQTGFPGASSTRQSIADMIRDVTSSLEQNDTKSAQSYLNKLVSFSAYLTARAGRFDQALDDMNASGAAFIDVPDTRTWVNEQLTDIPFRLYRAKKKSLGIRIAAMKDAEVVAKMVAAMEKRTGMKGVVAPPKATEGAKKAPGKPQETVKAKPAAETAKPATTKVAATPEAKPEPKKDDSPPWDEDDQTNVVQDTPKETPAEPTVDAVTPVEEITPKSEAKPREVFPTSASGFTPMNREQAEGIEKIQAFLADPKAGRVFVLDGKAGTGKTTIMQEALYGVLSKGKTVHISAVSHKAKTVLESKLNSYIKKAKLRGEVVAKAFAGLLGMEMKFDPKKQKTGFIITKKSRDTAPILDASIIVVDEASMLDQEAIDNILSMAPASAKIIFLGDIGQLAPIEGEGAVSPIFTNQEWPKHNLVERVRQGEDSAILPYADYYWNNSQSTDPETIPVPVDERVNKDGLTFLRTTGEMLAQYGKTFVKAVKDKNPNLIKVVAYNNKEGNAEYAANLRKLENQIRQLVHGKTELAEWEVGELVIMNNMFKVNEDTTIDNSREFAVTAVSAGSTIQFEIDGQMVAFPGNRVTVRDHDTGETFTMPVLSKDNDMAAGKSLKSKVQAWGNKISQMEQGPNKSAQWKKFFAVQQGAAELTYGYVITSHKAQGSTYGTSIVLEDNFNNMAKHDELNVSRGIYTAITRASQEVVIISRLNTVDQSAVVKKPAAPVKAAAPAKTTTPTPAPELEVVDQESKAQEEDDVVTPSGLNVPTGKKGKNHFSGKLMSDYPVQANATPAQKEKSKNQLANSFTAAEDTGLFAAGVAGTLASPAAMAERLGTDQAVIKQVFDLVNTSVREMNARLSGSIKNWEFEKLLKGGNLWTASKFFSLHAAVWDKNGIQFQNQIGQIMAWTGVQHMLDIVVPMRWSGDKKHAFIETYGNDILPMLEEGWVPLSDQVQQTADKLRRNLGLVATKTVTQTYTEGVLLSLASDALESLFVQRNADGKIVRQGSIEIREMTSVIKNEKGQYPKTNWIKVSAGNRDLLFDAAAALEPLFPERSNAAAATIGKPPKTVRNTYRGTDEKISEEQEIGLKKMGETEHRVSPLMGNAWNALPEAAILFIFGQRKVPRDEEGNEVAYTIAEYAQLGLNQTTRSDYKVIKNHLDRIKAYAEANNMDPGDVPSFFEHEVTTNGRAMTKGTSPQSSKAYREIISNVRQTIDTTKSNKGFMMAVAQGLGIKMDSQPIEDSLKELEAYLAEPSVQRALEAGARFGAAFNYADNNELMEEDLNSLFKMVVKGREVEFTPHAFTALVHMAKYKEAAKNKESFVSSLAYEIDGKTDGPINLMMMMGLRGGAEAMKKLFGLGGLFFGEDPIAVQDMTGQLQAWHDGSKDLYEIISKDGGKANLQRAKDMVRLAKKDDKESVNRMINAIGNVMKAAELVKEFGSTEIKHSRGFSKKATQAVGYLQGANSIVNDLANTLMEALSVLQDDKKLWTPDLQRDINFILSNEIKYNEEYGTSKITHRQNGIGVTGWDGRPLTRVEFEGLAHNLHKFGGHGLVEGTMKAVGYQRDKMMQAVQAVNAHVIFAQKKLTELYAAKQKELMAQGLLLTGQALSSKDEKAVVREVMDKYVPHPKVRTTAGLPVASLARNRVANALVERLQMGSIPSQYQPVSSAAFEDMGVSFAALSIMAGGDAAMVIGFYNNHSFNALNMYDGLYINPENIDDAGNALSHEVRKNWDQTFITNILESLPEASGEMLKAVDAWNAKQPEWMRIDYKSSIDTLKYQEGVQKMVLRETNAISNSNSHMAGHGSPHWRKGTPLNSTTLGTSTTDPLLDLAAEDLGNVANGIRKMSVADVKALMKDHTFENPVLSGLWRVLSPLLKDDLVLYMSSDKQAMADFYQQNERREMGQGVDGVSVGNAVYVRAVNAETMVHELLHATTKNLTATFFASPGSLTKQQQEAMKNLLALKAQFMEMDGSALPPHQRAMVEHVQAIMRGLDENSSLQEFLAYGLTNYHLQRTLGATKSTLGKLLESVFNAVKALFGFPDGTQSDSMLAQMFSNFEALTAQAIDQTYPVSVDEALNAINPDLARKFEGVLKILEEKATSDTSKIQAQAARTDGLIRMQEIAKTNLFPSLTAIQVAAGSYVQAMFAVGIQIKSEDNALLASVVDEVRDAGPKLWRSNDNPNDQADIALAEARYSFFFDPIIKPGANLSKERHEYLSTKHDLAADILAMTLVNPDFAQRMEKEVLGRKKIDKSKLNNWLDSVAEKIYELMNTGLTLKRDATLADALELAAVRMQKSMLASAGQRQQQVNPYRRMTNKLNEGVQHIGKKAGEAADKQLGLGKHNQWIGSGLMIAASLGNDGYADNLGRLTLSLTNQIEGMNPGRELIQEMIGTVTSNFKLIQLKGVATRMVSAVRQSFREQVPVTVKSWFTDLTPEQDELLHLVIGKMALYDVSEDIRDQMEQVLTDPAAAIQDAETTLLSGGDYTKRKLMVKFAKDLGNYMASKGTMALYRNTEAVRTLAIHGGGERLSDKELAALENLSTLQALTHLTTKQRQDTVSLFRENKEGFLKTMVLIHSFKNFDTQRAGKTTATLNFQKGWIPTESDNRKALRLVKISEVRKAERMGWVQVGKFADDPNMVYMATKVAKTPTLSGGAIHAVDKHMNGIHYHSGMPIDPGIQTTITNPKEVRLIELRILSGEVLPYTVLYDASNDAVGFQRLLDPEKLDLHTKTVGRISDAAGIWMGRLHEESIASGQNQAAVNLLGDTWRQAVNDKEEDEFVDIRSGRSHKGGPSDKVITNVWETLPYHTKRQLEAKFSDGSKNPPIWIRKDQLNDAIGYHKASAGNFFTRDNRYADNTNDHVAALARQMVGKGAYKYVIMGEEGWQAVIGSAKDTIIVKSLFIALNNLASNQTQLMMITGNPIWNIRVQSQKHKELVSYLGYQQRLAKLHAEEFATNDPNGRARIDAEQKQLHVQIRRLSIWPLIEAGELPTIAEGLSEAEEFSMMGDLTAWLEKQMGKMPPVVSTVLNNLAISKETSLYKGMDRMVQYGDFVAKATMYEWMTTQDQAAKKEAIKLLVNDKNPDKAKRINIAQALHIVALKEVNDEFVNYSRLPGRWRTYGEDMGMLWFFNYKLRIMKMTARRMRKNPAAFLIGSQVGGLLGVQTLLDTLPWNMNLAYSTGLDPLFTAHQTILWNQLFD